MAVSPCFCELVFLEEFQPFEPNTHPYALWMLTNIWAFLDGTNWSLAGVEVRFQELSSQQCLKYVWEVDTCFPMVWLSTSAPEKDPTGTTWGLIDQFTRKWWVHLESQRFGGLIQCKGYYYPMLLETWQHPRWFQGHQHTLHTTIVQWDQNNKTWNPLYRPVLMIKMVDSTSGLLAVAQKQHGFHMQYLALCCSRS